MFNIKKRMSRFKNGRRILLLHYDVTKHNFNANYCFRIPRIGDFVNVNVLPASGQVSQAKAFIGMVTVGHLCVITA